MKDSKKKNNTSDILESLVNENGQNQQEDTISLDSIKNLLHERGFGVILAVVTIPLCVPIPVPPGYTTIFSIPVFFICVQMILGLNAPWLPKKLGQKKIKKSFLKMAIFKVTPILRKIEKFLKPRLTDIPPKYWEKFTGVASFILNIFVFLPIPLPLSNFLPGVAILIMAIGLIGRDGVMILIGFVIGIVGIIYTLIGVFLGYEIINKLLSFF